MKYHGWTSWYKNATESQLTQQNCPGNRQRRWRQGDCMVLVQPQSIPKSTSGKPSRSRCQRLHENNILSEIYRNEDILHSKNLPEDVHSETTIKVIIRKVEVAVMLYWKFLWRRWLRCWKRRNRWSFRKFRLSIYGWIVWLWLTYKELSRNVFSFRSKIGCYMVKITRWETLQAILQVKKLVSGKKKSLGCTARSKRAIYRCISRQDRLLIKNVLYAITLTVEWWNRRCFLSNTNRAYACGGVSSNHYRGRKRNPSGIVDGRTPRMSSFCEWEVVSMVSIEIAGERPDWRFDRNCGRNGFTDTNFPYLWLYGGYQHKYVKWKVEWRQ